MAITPGLSLAGGLRGLFLFAHLLPATIISGCWLLLLATATTAPPAAVTALRLNRLLVPELQDYRQPATLACQYDLLENELNSVKWYKDGNEFFRYAPEQRPAVSQFAVVGVHVHNASIECGLESCRVQLGRLQPQSSGVYRCEVSGDAPYFKLASRMANMTVGALPQLDPIVMGLAEHYAYGDYIQADCMSDKSSPAAVISWSVNDVPIVPHKLQPMRYSDVDYASTFPLQNRTQDISFYIDPKEWGQVRQFTVKCTAALDGFPNYRRSRQFTVELGVTNTLSNERLVGAAQPVRYQPIAMSALIAGSLLTISKLWC